MTNTPQSPGVQPATAARRLPLRAVLLVLAFGYALQLFSPLRLPGDAMEYLSLAAALTDGEGFVYRKYPSGYPRIVSALERVGLGCSAAFVGLNCLFLAIGLAATVGLLRDAFALPRRWATGICCLTLLSYLVIKHVTLPLTDIPYFGISMVCVLSLTLSPRLRPVSGWCALCVGVILASVALTLRPVGAALVPAALWSLASRCRGTVVGRGRVTQVRQRRLIVGCVCAAAALLTARTEYASYFLHRLTRGESLYLYAENGVARTFFVAISSHLTEWGEIAANVPKAKLPDSLTPIFTILGSVAVGCAALGLASRRRGFGVVDVYAVTYAGILVAWPFSDARFWLPVLPIAMAYVALAWRRFASDRVPAGVGVLYLTGFSLLGLVALAYSTWISLSGARFPDRYGDGSQRATYRAAFSGQKEAETADVDAHVLRLLLRYERRAAAAQ